MVGARRVVGPDPGRLALAPALRVNAVYSLPRLREVTKTRVGLGTGKTGRVLLRVVFRDSVSDSSIPSLRNGKRRMFLAGPPTKHVTAPPSK